MQRSCAQCGQSFIFTPDDAAFLQKLTPVIGGTPCPLPPPTLCPLCRYQRRLAYRNERSLYYRTCDLSGRSMVSMHPPGTPFPVYHISQWMSDRWDPASYARSFDFSRPFFAQFKEFCDTIPHFNAFVDPHLDVNSEFTNCSSEAKNCYLISQAERNEDCYYSRGINRCQNCCDCFRVHQCEQCYEGIDLKQCYHCLYCQDCDNCQTCLFSTDLRGCAYCLGCHGLSHQQYCIFNQPVSKEQWNETLAALTLTHESIDRLRLQSDALRLTVPHRATHVIQCEDCTGDHITQCRQCHEVYDSNYLEHCRYCNEIASGAKDCMDYCMWGINCELLYECNGCGYNVHHSLFCNHCWQNVSNCLYCESCFPSVRDCFGCFGLRSARYCILNKQYTKEEYEGLVLKIIDHMRKTPYERNPGTGNPFGLAQSGQESDRSDDSTRIPISEPRTPITEWGQFFPVSHSPYAYNEALCQMFFPLPKEAVIQRGWRWREEEEQEQYLGPAVAVPGSIAETSDSICQQILRCTKTKRPYKIIPQELAFYRAMGLPIPRSCPAQRHLNRQQLRNPRRLWPRECGQCGTTVPSTFAPARPEPVYCQSCYLASIY